MTFPSRSRVQRLNKILQIEYKNYKLRYYDISPEEHNKIPPLMELTIIDRKEVILHIFGDGTNAKYVAIQNDAIVQYFLNYFYSVWYNATRLIGMNYCNDSVIQKLNSINYDNDNGNTETSMYEDIYR